MNQILVSPHSLSVSLAEIIHRLEEEADGFLAIVDADHHFLGTITLRDVRRGILHQKTSWREMINVEAYKLTTQQLPISPKQLGIQTNQAFIPVVDSENKLVEIIKIDPAYRVSFPNQVVIMAGGLGKRLGELTRDLPKPMLPMGHKPVLHIIIETLVEQGFREFFLCLNYKSEVIREYFGDGSSFGATIAYVEESSPMGTAGSLSLIKESFQHPFFVMNGDLITTLNLQSLLQFHREKEAIATMCLHEYNQQMPFGVVHTRNSKILSLEEKPYHKYFINAGIYLLNPAALDYLPYHTACDMTTVFDSMLQADEAVHAYIINEFWVDIGQTETYESTRNYFTHFNL
ncbi:MAG: nucleotidyltransferase family protein [Bacteroidota bacterium]